MKRFFLAIILLSLAFSATMAQDSTLVLSKRKIAIFTPLYLDSAFDAVDNYRYANNILPEFINPGLEFYEGTRLALDSLMREGNQLEVFVYDTRSSSETLQQLLNKPELDSVNLIIAHCSSAEVRQFADAGLKRNIPVINVNLPNDGGAKGNPYFVMLNPTLKTQCEGVYRFVQRNYAINPIIVFRKKGQLEDMIKNVFDEFSRNTVSIPLKLKYVDLPDSFNLYQLRAHLDSNYQSICIAGSFNEAFGRRLTQKLALLNKQYPVIAVGMPTWDAIARDFAKSEYKDLEIVYGTPFYNPKTDKISTYLTSYFNNVMFARPSDMVFRGYEVTLKYAKLLLQYGRDLASNLSNKQHKVFTDFDIQPVLNSQSMTLDYFENKKIYFLKLQNGIVKAVY